MKIQINEQVFEFDFDSRSDILVISPEFEIPKEIHTIYIKNLRRPIVLKSSGLF